jgi:hypothetical protein
LVIVSPWVTLAGIGRFDICSKIALAVASGVSVEIFTDPDFIVEQAQSPSLSRGWFGHELTVLGHLFVGQIVAQTALTNACRVRSDWARRA